MKEEHSLITELMAGSQEAFGTIYNMYAGRLYSFVFSYLRSSSETEDILQDIFVRLWQNRQSIHQTQSLKALLFTIGRNQIVSSYRKRVNMPAFEDYLAYSDAVEGDGARSLEYEEFYQSVLNALQKLPRRQREIIRLSRQEGLKNSEIALQLGLSEQTVKNQLSLGLKAVKAMLKGVPLTVIELMLLLM